MTSLSEAPSAEVLRDWRRKMCTGTIPWASRPGMIGSVNAGHCSLLTGLPTPDFNIVLVDSAGSDAFDAALRDIASVGAPALLALAGEGTRHAESLPDGFQLVGKMPIMATLLQPDGATDPRVRPAAAADVPAVARAWAAAYGFEAEVALQAADLIVAAGEPSRSWLLEHDGEVVSAVVSTHVDDTVTVWAMATPPEHARHGYGRALLGTVLAHAATVGARVGLLGATEAGYPLYESTGWRTVEHWSLAVSGVSAQFG